MKKPDRQQHRLYKAENVAIIKNGPEKHLRTIDDCALWTQEVINKPWFTRNFPLVEVEITDGRGHQNATCRTWGRGAKIRLPRWARTEDVILHELAHACCRKGEAHGAEFAGTYIYLVEKAMSKIKADYLRNSFRKRNVKFRRDSEVIPKP